jgi:hypothetical protein
MDGLAKPTPFSSSNEDIRRGAADPRARTKGNAERQRTCRGQSPGSVSQHSSGEGGVYKFAIARVAEVAAACAACRRTP